MDVAYRLAPETDMFGMVGDVKRALAWMKAHAGRLAVDPSRIVLGGSSAGGHLALLAAYAPDVPELTPSDVNGTETTPGAVVSYYGPCDLRACYFHTRQDQTTTAPPAASGGQSAGGSALARGMRAVMGPTLSRLGFDKPADTGSFRSLVGGHPDELPEAYAMLSPVAHVHPGCPPTLLIQGEDDLITPVAATQALTTRLEAAGVPVVSLVFPQTDHGFDLALPELSPPAQAAWRETQRFLSSFVISPAWRSDDRLGELRPMDHG
jgi:acetyl esterase/lipase